MAIAGRLARAFSSAGRIGPARALLVTAAAAMAGWGAVVALERGDTLAYLATGLLMGAVLAKTAAEAARRLHDTGLSGWVGLAVAVALLGILLAVGIATLDQKSGAPLRAAALLAALVAAGLLLRPGNPGANAHGPPPPSPLAHAGAARSNARPLAWAGASALGGMAFAAASIAWSHGMRDANERAQRFVHDHPAPR